MESSDCCSSDDFFPEVFDPFGDFEVDTQSWVFDTDTNTIFDKGQPVDNPEIVEAVTSALETGADPLTAARSAQEQINEAFTPNEPSDFLPETIFTVLSDDSVFFPDSSFSTATLRSFFGCKNRDIPGFALIPARYLPRIRSGKANHSKRTPVLWLRNIDDDFSALFH